MQKLVIFLKYLNIALYIPFLFSFSKYHSKDESLISLKLLSLNTFWRKRYISLQFESLKFILLRVFFVLPEKCFKLKKWIREIRKNSKYLHVMVTLQQSYVPRINDTLSLKLIKFLWVVKPFVRASLCVVFF